MYTNQTQARTSKGFISIGVDKDYLRLQFPRTLFADGKQRYVTLKLKDTPENRVIAEQLAKEAQGDLTRYQLGDESAFDFTLEKYKPQGVEDVSSQISSQPELTLDQLWEQYVAFKAKTASVSTIAKDYKKTERLINKLPTKSLNDAVAIRDWLVANCTPNAAKRYMTQINACCEHHLIYGTISRNPFVLVRKTITIPKSHRKNHDVIKAFTASERDAILNTFKSNRYYSHYYNYVYFCFYSGCRPSEAIALTWGNVSDSHIHFDCAVVEGVDGLTLKDGLKSQDARDFPMNAQMSTFMQSIKPQGAKPDDLVFPSPTGNYIDSHNFCNRAWKTVLDKLPNIQYLPPYHTRHTFITLCLDAGIHEKDVKRWCGNSAALIIAVYASFKRDLVVPEL